MLIYGLGPCVIGRGAAVKDAPLVLYFGTLCVLLLAILIAYGAVTVRKRRLRRQKQNGFKILRDMASRISEHRDDASPPSDPTDRP